MFEELPSLSLTLQRNDLVLPQATSEDSDQLEELKAGDMLEKIQTMLVSRRVMGGDSSVLGMRGITLKGNLKGFTDLTNPQLKQHMEAAINICVGELKARFGDLLKDEGTQSPIESFRDLNPDTWPEDKASLNPGQPQFQRPFISPTMGCGRSVDKGCLQLDYKCERGFSEQNRIKLQKKLPLGPPPRRPDEDQPGGGPFVEEFDPTPAVNRWLSSKRPPDVQKQLDD
ncbi:hypothetical protein QQF64_034047 [Cirrhinus molitorella]|uniref:Uncharacterized protein n=1 Tax=Cirrhinus molitorella TaxID=172907 RepID=A0ABR3MVL5_9TELE